MAEYCQAINLSYSRCYVSIKCKLHTADIALIQPLPDYITMLDSTHLLQTHITAFPSLNMR